MTTEPSGGDGRQALVLVLTAVCGLTGGLLAVGLLTSRFEAASLWTALLIVSGGGVLATAVAFVLLTARPAPPRRRHAVAPTQAPQQPWYQATANQGRPGAHRPHNPITPADPDPAPRADPGHLVLPLNDAAPVPDGGGGGNWWNKSAPAAAAATDQHTPAPNLSSYVADGTALVAQCPNCGDFRIDVHRGEKTYAFRCRNPRCGEEWRWTPGTAWPSVVVRRNLTGRERG